MLARAGRWGGEVSGEEIRDCCDAEGGKANSHSVGYLLLQLGVSGKESSDPPLPCFDTPTHPHELPLCLALPTEETLALGPPYLEGRRSG